MDETFKIRAYGVAELALLYSPNLNKDGATAQLRSWIRGTPSLLDDLVELGYKPKLKRLTPKQVKIIVDYLGEP